MFNKRCKIEKIDIHKRQKQYQNTLQKLESDRSMIRQNKELILRFIRDCRLGKTLKKRQKKRIGVARCLKYIQILKKISVRLDKPFNKVKQEDIEKFIEALEDDKYKYEVRTESGKLLKTGYYAYSTKLDYKKTIKKFYKWLLGNNDYYPELVEWIETYDISKEIPALRREEIENFNKKSLYILIREMTDVNTSHITKVVNVFKKKYQNILNEFSERGTIENPIDKSSFF